jgi:tagaturonate reductase
VLDIFSAAWQQPDDLGRLVHKLLSDTRLWGEDLTTVSGLAEQTAAALARINAVGVKAAMAEL